MGESDETPFTSSRPIGLMTSAGSRQPDTGGRPLSETTKLLDEIQRRIRVDNAVLNEARTRRDVVLRACATFPGALGTYMSGSVAMGVVNDPIEDADGGMILDRRFFPLLGPDGCDGSPTEVVQDLHTHIGPIIRKTYPNATVHDMKRGVTVYFHAPMLSGDDPYVDAVVAMNRKDAVGLWIPNMDQDRWDPSHPQKHVELMLAGSRDVRVTRARVVRLAKAWNKQYSDPSLSSFNIVALALEAIDQSMPIDKALLAFFEHAASSLALHRTEDPAHVSGPINIEGTKDQAVKRLAQARDHLRVCRDAEPDAVTVTTELSCVFWTYIDKPIDLTSKAAVAATLAVATPRFRHTAAGTTAVGAVKSTRSFGGPRG